MIGYNNINFDSWFINLILSTRNTHYINLNKEMFELATKLTETEERLYINSMIPQQDLFKMYHFDSKAKMTSLKWIEFMMDFDNLQDVDWNNLQGQLTADQIEMVLSYNLNDVKATYELYKRSQELITTRREISNQYNLNLMSASEPRIVKEVFAWYLCKELNISYKELKQLRTKRDVIYPKDFILKEASFQTQIFQNVLNSFKALEIRETKGSFEKTIYWNDCEIKYALGGIHGATSAGIYESNDEDIILSLDVKSFYPNLAIKHK